jgi:DNA-binding NtrC family response regulator
MRNGAPIPVEGLQPHDDEREAAEHVKQRLVGVSRWALAAPALVVAHARHANPLVVEGEPGAGKEFFARLVHDCGARAGRPFVVVAADSLHESVLQAILFEAPGSLPAATRALQREYAEQARGGTLYIADVAPLSPELHGRIARFIAHPELEHSRRHSLQGRHVRVVFGASAPVAAGAIRVPPLRERVEDVGLLAEHFATQLCHRLGKEPRVLSPGAVATMRAHPWPGNVGELKRVVELMVRRSGPPTLDVSALPLSGLNAVETLQEGINLHDEVQRYEKSLLFAALERCGGVQTRAAQLLGLKISTLNSKLSNYRIDASAFKS